MADRLLEGKKAVPHLRGWVGRRAAWPFRGRSASSSEIAVLIIKPRPPGIHVPTMDEPLRLVSDPAPPEGLAAPSEQVTGFEDLVEAESPGLYGALCLIAGDRFEAEDVMQEAFLKVWERWDRVRNMDDPTGYLYRTALNVYRSACVEHRWRSDARSVSRLPATNSPRSSHATPSCERSRSLPRGSG